jgi:hypothetical protein
MESSGRGRDTASTYSWSSSRGDYVLLCPVVGKDGAHYKLGQLAQTAIE